MWQLQARRIHSGVQWEPISVEPIETYSQERRYHYETLDECKSAFIRYVDTEGSLPNLIVRHATGETKLTDVYEIRAVWTSEPGMILTPQVLSEHWNRLTKPTAHPEAPVPSIQQEPNKMCICNPYAEHSAETAPNCPIHGIRARGGVYESTKEDS